ncbi:MAG: Hpt domain-containing protein [Mycetocola sp.]
MNSPLDTPFPLDDTGYLPLLNPEALDALLGSLDSDQTAVDGFVTTFVTQWPARMLRAESSVAGRDFVGIYDCALSIKVAAQMVGAVRLSACGSELERLVRSGHLDEAAMVVDALREVGTDTITALISGRRSVPPAQAA